MTSTSYRKSTADNVTHAEIKFQPKSAAGHVLFAKKVPFSKIGK
jgi:hypothetical protein